MLGGDWTDGTMTDFKWHHFPGAVILWAVRWYCRYPISYRDLEAMLAERGISVDHTTIYRWVHCYAPDMEKRLRWFWRRGFVSSSFTFSMKRLGEIEAATARATSRRSAALSMSAPALSVSPVDRKSTRLNSSH